MRNTPLLALAAIFLTLNYCSGESSLASSRIRFPADNKSSGKVVFKKSDKILNEKIEGPFYEEERYKGCVEVLRIVRENDVEYLYFKSTHKPGKVFFRTKSGLKLSLIFYFVIVDLDNDGFPDSSELNSTFDRRAFRQWFVRIAESQFLQRNFSWKSEERDCAGLIRYCYREALKKHDIKWHKESGIVVDKNLPDVIEYNYPDIPVIGRKIFKIKESGEKGRLGEPLSFGNFADAKTLLTLNTFLVSRKIEDAEKGDLLFFINEGNENFPYHSMIVAGHEKGEIMIIYHTGEGDILKRVPSAYLEKSGVFNPAPWNKNFLGVYRFNILE